MFYKTIRRVLFIFSAAVLLACGGDKNSKTDPENLPRLTSVPSMIDKNCGNGRAKLYDECSDQLLLFKQAQSLAKAEKKTLLISYGAEWCIWCHVFYKYVNGQSDQFTYTYGEPGAPQQWTDTLKEKAKVDPRADALALTKYVRKNFVLFHLESDNAPNGEAVLELTGAATHYGGWVPFIYSVDADGQYLSAINYEEVQVRRDNLIDWYRGYDRKRLLGALKALESGSK